LEYFKHAAPEEQEEEEELELETIVLDTFSDEKLEAFPDLQAAFLTDFESNFAIGEIWQPIVEACARGGFRILASLLAGFLAADRRSPSSHFARFALDEIEPRIRSFAAFWHLSKLPLKSDVAFATFRALSDYLLLKDHSLRELLYYEGNHSLVQNFLKAQRDPSADDLLILAELERRSSPCDSASVSEYIARYFARGGSLADQYFLNLVNEFPDCLKFAPYLPDDLSPTHVDRYFEIALQIQDFTIAFRALQLTDEKTFGRKLPRLANSMITANLASDFLNFPFGVRLALVGQLLSYSSPKLLLLASLFYRKLGDDSKCADVLFCYARAVSEQDHAPLEAVSKALSAAVLVLSLIRSPTVVIRDCYGDVVTPSDLRALIAELQLRLCCPDGPTSDPKEMTPAMGLLWTARRQVSHGWCSSFGAEIARHSLSVIRRTISRIQSPRYRAAVTVSAVVGPGRLPPRWLIEEAVTVAPHAVTECTLRREILHVSPKRTHFEVEGPALLPTGRFRQWISAVLPNSASDELHCVATVQLMHGQFWGVYPARDHGSVVMAEAGAIDLLVIAEDSVERVELHAGENRVCVVLRGGSIAVKPIGRYARFALYSDDDNEAGPLKPATDSAPRAVLEFINGSRLPLNCPPPLPPV
jgi:hypothetical protein